MTSPGNARGRLTLVHDAGPGTGARAASQETTRVVLGPSEWALALTPHNAPVGLQQCVRDLTRRAGRSRTLLAGRRCLITRVGPGALNPRLGPAVLCHSGRGAVLYCDGGQIRAPAAEALGLLSGRALGLIRAGRLDSLEVRVLRVQHRVLGVLNPAALFVRQSEVVAHVCSQQMTGPLAETTGVLLTAYARELARLAQSGELRPASPA